MAALNSSNKVTCADLLQILNNLRPDCKPPTGSDGSKAGYFDLGCSMNEVYPRLFVGDIGSAEDLTYLEKIGITHVINAAYGQSMFSVQTDEAFYSPKNIKFLGLSLNDVPTEDISKYFESSSNFIEQALQEDGRILVNCYMGISRSATVCAAFLMMKRNMNALDAITQIRKNRMIHPNSGFLKQLVLLNDSLSLS